ADPEEDRLYLAAAELVEDLRGVGLVGPIVEGEDDLGITAGRLSRHRQGGPPAPCSFLVAVGLGARGPAEERQQHEPGERLARRRAHGRGSITDPLGARKNLTSARLVGIAGLEVVDV